jgi:peroxiredoxin Q/BCP
MAQLRDDYPEFEQQDAAILVIGPENAQSFKGYWEKHELPFRGLPDPQHQILKLYGQEVNLFKLGRMPAMVIVDRSGLVRFVHYGHDMTDIPANQDVLQSLQDLNEVSRRQ